METSSTPLHMLDIELYHAAEKEENAAKNATHKIAHTDIEVAFKKTKERLKDLGKEIQQDPKKATACLEKIKTSLEEEKKSKIGTISTGVFTVVQALFDSLRITDYIHNQDNTFELLSFLEDYSGEAEITIGILATLTFGSLTFMRILHNHRIKKALNRLNNNEFNCTSDATKIIGGGELISIAEQIQDND